MSELSKLPALDSGKSPGQHLLKIKSPARGWLAGVLVIGSLEGWNMPSIDMQQLTLDLHIILFSRACTERVTVTYMHMMPCLAAMFTCVDLGILGGLITQA